MAKRRAIDSMQAVVASASRTAAGESAAARRSGDGLAGTAQFVEVPIGAVAANVRNVRRSVGDIEQLAQSIAEEGVLEPLVVRPIVAEERAHYPGDAKYAVVMGERRLAASRQAGRTEVPVVVRTDIRRTDEIKLMLIENLQRESLTPIDEALGYRQLIEEGPQEDRLSQRALAKQIGVTQAHISRRLKLLGLHPDLQALVNDGRIGVDVAANHLADLGRAEQAEVAERVAAKPAKDWEPAEIRNLAAEAKHAALVRTVRADQRDKAREAGAAIYESVEELPEDVRDDLRAHRIWDRAAIANAGRSDNLLAVITDYRTSGPEWYVSDTAGITPPPPPPATAQEPPTAAQPASPASADGRSEPEVAEPVATGAESPAPATNDSAEQPTAEHTAADQHAPIANTVEPEPTAAAASLGEPLSEENTPVISQALSTDAAMSAWATVHRRVKRPELEAIARWVAERIPDDEPAGLVRSWLRVDEPWSEWHAGLLADPYAEATLRAVFLYSVASDLVASRDNPDSPAGRRTAERLAEQLPEGGRDDG
jgi:ParB/RepB/Spo0J family partition protein